MSSRCAVCGCDQPQDSPDHAPPPIGSHPFIPAPASDDEAEAMLKILTKWGQPPTRSNDVWQARLDGAVREAYRAGFEAGKDRGRLDLLLEQNEDAIAARAQARKDGGK